MDYIIGYLLGYFIRTFINYLNSLVDIKVPDNYKEEDWDWIALIIYLCQMDLHKKKCYS